MRSTSEQSGFGRSGRACASGGAPLSIRFAVSSSEPFQNGCQPASDSQSIDADRPDVRRRAAGLAVHEPLRRDVGERAGHVAGGRQRLLLGELGEPEVEQPHRDVAAFREQHVRGLHVTVDDPALVGVREPLEHLRGGLDRGCVIEPAGPHRLPHRLAGHVLVRDVDVARVAVEAVGAQAALVAQARRRERLALRARGRLALARDDLERHVEAVLLVAREPDRARAAAAERAQGPVALGDELARGQRNCWFCHGLLVFGSTPRLLPRPTNSVE